MRGLWILILFFGLVFAVPAAAEYREFTSADGKTIRGRIKSYDAPSQTVTIERDNKRTAKVSITIFSEEDQAYILEWNSAQGFMLDRFLKCSISKQDGERRTEVETGTVTSTGGDSREEELSKSHYEKFYFELNMHNRNKMDLAGLRAAYIIYYEQSETTWDKPVAAQLTNKGDITVPEIKSGEKTVVATKPVEIYKVLLNELNWVGGASRTGGKGAIHGARIRLYMKLPSGKEVMREFSYPEKLSEEKFPWSE